jgi:hypothetical protein
MIGQYGRGQSESEVGLRGCHVDHHGLLFSRGSCAPSVSPPTTFFLPRHILSSRPLSSPPVAAAGAGATGIAYVIGYD